ncbi:Hairless [Carabus blaptoides fortunei]
MTEGEHRIHGMNGVTDSGSAAATKEECPQTSDTYNLGGRLKFFKNGRFILELARAREGEKVAWVPVPKKTFWPPQGSASSVSTYRQESSTSLSVSDDNSSVQSSPWQRDHTWKQTTPQRNASSHLSFCYMRRPRGGVEHVCSRYHVQRSPYTPFNSERTKCIASDNDKCNRCVNKSAIITSAVKPRPSLIHIVQVLWNKSLQALNSITSPRKRILRELERVTIDDLSYKRCRGKVQQPTANVKTVPAPVASVAVTAVETVVPAEVNGSSVIATVDEQRVTAKNCSYSITSLLGGKVDSRDDKLSSQYLSAPRITAHHHHHQQQQQQHHHHHRTTGNDDGATAAYTQDTVDGPVRPVDHMNSKRSPLTVTSGSPSLPSSPADPYHQGYPAHQPSYVSPYAVYPALGHHGYVTPYYSAAYGRGTPGYYPTMAHPAVAPPLTRHDQSPYSWAVPAATYEHALQRDDTISDVPLNLSKHAD